MVSVVSQTKLPREGWIYSHFILHSAAVTEPNSDLTIASYWGISRRFQSTTTPIYFFPFALISASRLVGDGVDIDDVLDVLVVFVVFVVFETLVVVFLIVVVVLVVLVVLVVFVVFTVFVVGFASLSRTHFFVFFVVVLAGVVLGVVGATVEVGSCAVRMHSAKYEWSYDRNVS